MGFFGGYAKILIFFFFFGGGGGWGRWGGTRTYDCHANS